MLPPAVRNYRKLHPAGPFVVKRDGVPVSHPGPASISSNIAVHQSRVYPRAYITIECADCEHVHSAYQNGVEIDG
jgi:biotin synthase-related radical SAM superfamily protein